MAGRRRTVSRRRPAPPAARGRPVIAAVVCLAAALALWPVPTARARLPALLRVPRSDQARVRLGVALGPLPVAVATGALVLVVSTPLVGALAGGCAGLGFRSWSGTRG